MVRGGDGVAQMMTLYAGIERNKLVVCDVLC